MGASVGGVGAPVGASVGGVGAPVGANVGARLHCWFTAVARPSLRFLGGLGSVRAAGSRGVPQMVQDR